MALCPLGFVASQLHLLGLESLNLLQQIPSPSIEISFVTDAVEFARRYHSRKFHFGLGRLGGANPFPLKTGHSWDVGKEKAARE